LSFVCDQLEALSSWGIPRGLFSLAGLADSVRCTIQDRRPTVIHWDGQDWSYRWHQGRLFYPLPSSNPRSLVEDNWDIFTHSYSPRGGDTVVDIGAGIGTEVELLSRLVGPDGLVVAVEADPDCLRQLRKLVRSRRLNNVVVVHAAVADRSGKAVLQRFGQDGATNTILPADEHATKVVVPQLSLEDLLDGIGATVVNYLKMNIEGAERLALRGFTSSTREIRHWCVSCHDFLGVPEAATRDFVESWFLDRGVPTERFPSTPDRPWANYYVFAPANGPD
jgi:FkbM family methyltransferase